MDYIDKQIKGLQNLVTFLKNPRVREIMEDYEFSVVPQPNNYKIEVGIFYKTEVLERIKEEAPNKYKLALKILVTRDDY